MLAGEGEGTVMLVSRQTWSAMAESHLQCRTSAPGLQDAWPNARISGSYFAARCLWRRLKLWPWRDSPKCTWKYQQETDCYDSSSLASQTMSQTCDSLFFSFFNQKYITSLGVGCDPAMRCLLARHLQPFLAQPWAGYLVVEGYAPRQSLRDPDFSSDRFFAVTVIECVVHLNAYSTEVCEGASEQCISLLRTPEARQRCLPPGQTSGSELEHSGLWAETTCPGFRIQVWALARSLLATVSLESVLEMNVFFDHNQPPGRVPVQPPGGIG
jgi:hypothetical protein